MKQLITFAIKISLIFIVISGCYQVRNEQNKIIEAEYQFGKDSLNSFILRNLKWPDKMVSGPFKIYVELDIDQLGNLKNVKVLNPVAENFDAEAVRVIKLIPKWIPTKQDDKNVSSKKTISIEFKME